MSSLIYRFANESDLEQLIKLRVLMQKEVNSIVNENIDEGYLDKVRQYFIRAMTNKNYFSSVAELSGELVAAIGLAVYEKPPSLTGLNGRNGYITNVYTMSEWRRQGVASKLIELIVEHARNSGIDKLHLGTREASKGVYERVGFKPTHLPHLELKLVSLEN